MGNRLCVLGQGGTDLALTNCFLSAKVRLCRAPARCRVCITATFQVGASCACVRAPQGCGLGNIVPTRHRGPALVPLQRHAAPFLQLHYMMTP